MNNYPTKKVIIGYTLLGGLTGGVFVLVFTLIIDLVFNKQWRTFDEMAEVLTFAVMAGTPSAFLTGVYLARTKSYLKNKTDAFKCALVGFIATFLPYFLLLLAVNGADFDKSSLNALVAMTQVVVLVGMVGAMSAVILAAFLLPKRLEKLEKTGQ